MSEERIVYTTALLMVSLEVRIGRREAEVIGVSEPYDIDPKSDIDEIEMGVDLNGGRKLTEGQLGRVADALNQLDYEDFRVRFA